MEQIHLLHLLQRAAALVEDGRRAAQQNHRRAGRVRVRHAGERVGHARARGDHRHAHAARDPRIGIRGVRGGLLVAGVDDLDALLHAARVDGRHVQPREREDVPHALLLQHPRDELPASHHSHAVSPAVSR